MFLFFLILDGLKYALLSLSALDAVDMMLALPSLLSLSVLDVVDIKYFYHRQTMYVVHFLKINRIHVL